jgi:hypothetical protein
LHFGLFLSTTSTMLGRKESVDVPKTFVAFLSLHSWVLFEWERQALSPSRNHPGTLVWEPLAGDWDGGWECIFVHEWAFLAGAWAGVFGTWAWVWLWAALP